MYHGKFYFSATVVWIHCPNLTAREITILRYFARRMTRFWNACRFHLRLINEPCEQLSQIFSSVTSALYLLVKLRSDLRFDRPNYDNIQICHGGSDFFFEFQFFIAVGVFQHSLKKPMFFTEKLRNENKKFSTIIQLATCLLHRMHDITYSFALWCV